MGNQGQTPSPTKASTIRGLAWAAAAGVLNQALSSGANFLVGAILVRQLSREAFGAWGLAFSVFLLALNVADAVVLVPLAVAIARAKGGHGEEVAARLLVGAAGILAALALPLALVAAGLLHRAVPGGVGWMALLVAAASIPVVAKEAMIRVAYSLDRPGAALVVNVTFLVVAMALLASTRSSASSPLWAVGTYGGAAAAATLAGAWRMGIFAWSLPGVSSGAMTEMLREGRWYLGSNLASWLRMQAPILAAGWILGPAAVGLITAGRLLVTPPIILNPALGQVALPRLARAAEAGDLRSVRKGQTLLGAVLLGTSLIYAAVLLLGFGPVAALMLGPSHGVTPGLASAWVAFAVIMALRFASELGLKATRLARSTLTGNLAAAAVAVPLCAIAATSLHETAVIAASAVAEAVAVLLLLILGRRALAEKRGDTDMAGARVPGQVT